MSFSDKPARYLGFGAAVGKSISPLVDEDLVRACYAVGALFIFLHVLVDIIDTGNIFKVLDTLVFELIASAFLPTTMAINLMRLVDNILHRLDAARELREYAPTAITLLIVFATTDYRDGLVNNLMNMTIRKLLK